MQQRTMKNENAHLHGNSVSCRIPKNLFQFQMSLVLSLHLNETSDPVPYTNSVLMLSKSESTSANAAAGTDFPDHNKSLFNVSS